MQTISIDREPSRSPRAGKRVYRQASPTELIYISTHTAVVSRSRIAGVVNRDQFNTAVGYLERRYGILRSAVENGKFVERIDGKSSVEAWLSSDTSSADAVYAGLLNAQLDASVGIYQIHVIAGTDALDVFLLSSHSVTDATTLIELHSCLAHMCDCAVRGVTLDLDQQPFPEPIDGAVRAALDAIPADRVNAAPALFAGVFAEIPMRAQNAVQSLNHRLERIVIDAEDMHVISAASHVSGSSVHSLLLAAFALAIRDASLERADQILLRSNVDLRRRLEPHVLTELVFSAITAHITQVPDLDRPLFEIARHIFTDVHESMADGSIFQEYLNYPKTFGSPQQAPVALNVSDMQTVTFHWSTERLKVNGFEYALGWAKKFPNMSVAVFEDTLIANIVYVEEFIDPTMMRAISDNFVKILVSACRAGQ